ELLEHAEGGHLSAEEIYQQLLEEGEQTGLATVYRVLTQFEQADLVLRHNFEGGKAVFELNRGDHHDHMVCTDTGDVIEFHNEEIEELQRKIAKAHGYDLVDHSLVLYVTPQKK
ncbi:MAG: transcriptional repressor, partial [Pseudomonadales bacterium]